MTVLSQSYILDIIFLANYRLERMYQEPNQLLNLHCAQK